MATIVIKRGRRFTRWWFFSGDGFDYMAALWRDLDGPWTMEYRFRYYVDDKAQDSDDEKSWWTATLPVDLDEAAAEAMGQRAAESTRDVFQTRGGRECSELQTLQIHSSDVAEVSAIVMKQPWSHPVATGRGGVA